MSTADMTHNERLSYFAFHGGPVERARAQFMAAARAYGKALEDSGAYERASTNATRFVEQVMDRADGCLSDEWKAYFDV